MSRPRRHLAAVMFTDMADYTALVHRDEVGALDARSRHSEALYSSVAKHGGEVIQFLGDGGVCTFSSAVEAVRAAIEVQGKLTGHPRLPLRIGIDQGEITYDEQGIVGDCVNVAARLQALAVPGGIAITRSVVDEIRNHREMTAIGIGDSRLKGIARPVGVYAVAAPGVAVPDGAVVGPGDEGSGSNLEPGRSPPAAQRRTQAATLAGPRPTIPAMPLVGREADLSVIRSTLDAAEAGRGRTLFLAGESGVGKTRLAEVARDEAKRRGWRVAVGRANHVETDLPYALLADALLPTIEALPELGSRAAITDGVLDDLALLFPALSHVRPADSPQTRTIESTDFRNRLFWNFAQFLRDLASTDTAGLKSGSRRSGGGDRDETRPLLIILEDTHWADASSLELFHFLARQTTTARIAFIATYRTDDDSDNKWQRDIERSLVALGAATCHAILPLTYAATDELVRRAFGIPETISRPFTALLFGWTRGNPFFIDELLKTLIESGSLHKEQGAWLGWELDELQLPQSVRETVTLRAARLTDRALQVAEYAAVLGGRFRFDQLRAVTGMSTRQLLPVIDELDRQRIIVETGQSDTVSYEFAHPIVRETLYANLGRARAGVLHGAVAEALEGYYDASALAHAGELAYHYARAMDRSLADKAVRFLEAAGRAALATRANPEALKYLRAALDRIETGIVVRTPDETSDVVSSLAHAHQRMGRTEAAIELWTRACGIAESSDDAARVARIRRRLGLAHYWAGEAAAALEHLEAGAAAARQHGESARLAMLQVARGLCLQELGRPGEALEELKAALEQAETIGESSLLARVHRALLLLYLWTGPAELAAAHGEQALDLAEESGEVVLSFWVHWAMGVLAGLTGDARGLVAHVSYCDSVAERLRSPLLRIWAAELSVEFAFGDGRWDEGLAIGENAISMARALNQTTLLPRLLVWTALIHIGRNDIDRGRAFIQEAWTLAGITKRDETLHGRLPGAMPLAAHSQVVPSVHVVIPAHIGLAAMHLARDDFEGAIAVAESALEIVDRTGYDVWAVHRLLPVAAEASLYLRDLDRARHYGARLRASAERFGNLLGLAWADACDALTVWLSGDPERGAEMMKLAIVELEAIPFRFDAARLRRQLAGRLADMGDTKGALRELNNAKSVFEELGAKRELERVRIQYQELGARPPSRRLAGASGLTGRELEVARAIADHQSNKAIAAKLGIKVRTVTTHVSNIIGKLGVTNRHEVAEVIRKAELAGDLTLD